MTMMSAADTAVDAHEDILAGEYLRPVLDREQAVERHLHTLLEGPQVLIATDEVRRVEDAAVVDLRYRGEQVLDLPT